MRRYIPFHVHSHYSLLEGADSPDALLQRAAGCGYPALALTDTNNLYGAVPFVEAARKHGVRPILGACLRHGNRRCTVLIAEPVGYESLCRILSRLHLQEQPVLSELLAENAAGLHVLADEVSLLERLREPFGPRLWMELVRPSASAARERALLEHGQRLGLKPVASTAAHFATPDGYDLYRLLTAVRQHTLIDRVPAVSLRDTAKHTAQLPITRDHYLVDAETLCQRFRDLPEAVVNTERLAEQCRSDVLPRGLVLPPARVPKAHDAVNYLRLLCERGLRRHAHGLQPVSVDSYRDRLEQELHIIRQRDLAGYFLVVRDIARDARRRGFGMALRGSAGNSLVCYLLGITNVDPLRFDLPMERFLHAGRPDLPDIDLDFDWKVRDQVIASVFERYGDAHTAMISSHLFLQPASAFREAAKVHGLSNEQISRLLETCERSGLFQDDPQTHRLAVSRRDTAPAGFPLEPARWPRLLADARRLLNRPHHLSIHPGGIIVTPRPIENYVPLQRAAKGIVITQFEKDAIEHIGLVKIDLLGNRALSTVDEARRRLGGGAGVRWRSGEMTARPHHLTTSPPRHLTILQRGDTLGVNQLESPAMRHLLVQMQPRNVLDVIQALALIRPGAASIGSKEKFIRRRRGLEPMQYDHPALEPLLKDTCGLMLYEDDALGVVQALTDFSAPEADRFRKQVTKLGSAAEAEALSRAFLAACAKNEVSREAARAVWVQLAKFNSYSFCKSHAVSYGLIAWEAVRLKAEHPLCFWVAALNNNQGMYPRRVYVEGAKRSGIPFSLPCVNRSEGDFTLEEGGIRTPLSAIRSLDEATGEAILDDRERRGPYGNLADFRRRVPIGPETLALLIQAGAFDFTGQSRPALMLETELDKAIADCRLQIADSREDTPMLFNLQSSIFNLQSGDWVPADYSRARQWKEEWDLLGFLVGPPLMQLFRAYLPSELKDSRSLPTLIGRTVRVAGLVATARHTTTKHGQQMQFVTLEDEWGFIDVTLFPGTCPQVTYLGMGPYLVQGKVEEQHDVITLTATRWEKARFPV